MHKVPDLYTDFLIACPTQASATFMSAVTEGAVSHIQITRLLSSLKVDSKAIWKIHTQQAHLYESIMAFVKLEVLK